MRWICGAAGLFLAAALAQEPADPPLFRSGVTLVKVDAQVVGRGGAAIGDLSRDDFRILDEGVPQPIAYFGHAAEPIDLLLLLDISGSMRKSIEELAAVSAAALRLLEPGDRAGVMLFSRRTETVQELTADRRAVDVALRTAFEGHDLGAGTFVNASLIAAARYLAGQPIRGRRAILIVTDNQGVNYQLPDEAALRELYGADTVLNAIVTENAKRPNAKRERAFTNSDFTSTDVFKLAEQSGGEAISGGKMSQTLPGLIQRIRLRYTVDYVAPASAPGAFRRIQVELTPEARKRHPDAVVRARAGYYAAR